MIFILNLVFKVVFYVIRWTKQYHICIYIFKKLNQLTLLYICICLYLQSILNFVFTIVFYVTRFSNTNSLDTQTIHLNIHFSIQLINSFSAIYKNFKMINITYMISILNSVLTVVFYAMRWTKQDHICICF
jgi:hypothetical protein